MKTKIKKAFIALFMLLSISNVSLRVPIKDTYVEMHHTYGGRGSITTASPTATYNTLTGYVPIFAVNLSRYDGSKVSREIDYPRLAFDIILIGAGVAALYYIASIFVKEPEKQA